MSVWGSKNARKVLRALKKIGWTVERESGGSHKVLTRPGWPNYTFSFHDGAEIGPAMLARIGKQTGLKPSDL